MPVLGVILAGGLSRRMGGGDKPLLRLGGRTLLDRVHERFAPQCAAGVILNANGDPGRFAGFTGPIVPDGVPGHPGPLAGILAALDHAASHQHGVTHVASVTGDAPFLPLNLVRRLSDALSAESTNHSGDRLEGDRSSAGPLSLLAGGAEMEVQPHFEEGRSRSSRTSNPPLSFRGAAGEPGTQNRRRFPSLPSRRLWVPGSASQPRNDEGGAPSPSEKRTNPSRGPNEGRSSCPIAVASSSGRQHFTTALWSLALRDDLRATLVERDERRVGAYLARHGAVAVEWAAAPIDPFLNVNTPEDLEAAEALLLA